LIGLTLSTALRLPLHTRHAARLLLYERDAAAAAIVQSVELGNLCGGEERLRLLRAEMLPETVEGEMGRQPGFWRAATPALQARDG